MRNKLCRPRELKPEHICGPRQLSFPRTVTTYLGRYLLRTRAYLLSGHFRMRRVIPDLDFSWQTKKGMNDKFAIFDVQIRMCSISRTAAFSFGVWLVKWYLGSDARVPRDRGCVLLGLSRSSAPKRLKSTMIWFIKGSVLRAMVNFGHTVQPNRLQQGAQFCGRLGELHAFIVAQISGKDIRVQSSGQAHKFYSLHFFRRD